MGAVWSSVDDEWKRIEYMENKTKSSKHLANRWKYFDTGRQKMVNWFASHLFSTGLDLLISTKLSSSHDIRVLNALSTRANEDIATGKKTLKKTYYPIEDESIVIRANGTVEEKKDIWIDFAADTGDGFDSSYSVTYKLTRPILDITDEDNRVIKTERGSVLILGGDLAYPTPTVETYDLRFKKLYEMAFPWSDETVPGCENLPPPYSPRCYSVPGNHDWYDSLNIYNALFLRGRSAQSIPPLYTEDAPESSEKIKNIKAEVAQNNVWLGGYSLGQDQTYFALKLPKNWWMFGFDLGLFLDIDINQLRYFLGVAMSIPPTSNIIITCHEPQWWSKDFRRFPMNINRLLKVLRKINLPVRLWLAGDIHNYSRDTDIGPITAKDTEEERHLTEPSPLTAPGQFHKIIAGGGGAFLHPTYTGLDTAAGHIDGYNAFEKKVVYPSARTCYRLAFRNLLFPYYNPTFGFVTAALYTMLLWWLSVGDSSGSALHTFFKFHTPMPTTVAAVIALGCIYFSTGSALRKVVMGGFHFAAHVGGIVLVDYINTLLTKHISCVGNSLISALTYVAGGYLVGSMIMGMYLLGSSFIGTHWNESFGSIKVEDYKSFVRMHITEEGDLEVFAIGIDKINKKWETTPAAPNDHLDALIRPVRNFKHKLVDRILIKKDIVA